ncbi:MAG: hypothetical protein ACLQG3_18235 [Terracidiphilus sp.]
MWWLASIVFVGLIELSWIQRAEQSGQWKWSRFALALSFGVFESFLIAAPLFLADMINPYFLWVAIPMWVLAVVLMVKFAIWAKRWTVPDSKALRKPDPGQR